MSLHLPLSHKNSIQAEHKNADQVNEYEKQLKEESNKGQELEINIINNVPKMVTKIDAEETSVPAEKNGMSPRAIPQSPRTLKNFKHNKEKIPESSINNESEKIPQPIQSEKQW